MPTNLYGPNDNYDLSGSHVLPALLRKIITAKKNNDPSVEIWGTGTPKREFLHVDDLAGACYFVMKNYSGADILNIGVGEDITILELTNLIKQIVGYNGEIKTNPSMPDGTPRKLMDVARINQLGWKASIPLEQGIRSVYEEVKDRF
jgi:GDP-L-fucose synthase